jgi:hypothetical protein
VQNCVNQGDFCILGSRVVCQACNQLVQGLVLILGQQMNTQVMSEDRELRPKKAKVVVGFKSVS